MDPVARAFFCSDFGAGKCSLAAYQYPLFCTVITIIFLLLLLFLKFLSMLFRFPVDNSHPIWYTNDKEEIKGFLTVTAPFFLRMETR